ncbi:MAG: hypothetical protein ACP5OG_04630 [Candidatus Nanoarchaeia archaeon]
MDKELGKIKKNDTTEIIIRVDEYKGKKGLTIREYVTSERYTGFTKAGTRIPAESFLQFREMINGLDYNEFMNSPSEEKQEKLEKAPKEKKAKAKKEVTEETEEEPSEEDIDEEDLSSA